MYRASLILWANDGKPMHTNQEFSLNSGLMVRTDSGNLVIVLDPSSEQVRAVDAFFPEGLFEAQRTGPIEIQPAFVRLALNLAKAKKDLAINARFPNVYPERHLKILKSGVFTPNYTS